MTGIDPVSLGIGGVQAAGKLGLAAYQAYKAANLKFQDTTTPEQREALAIARQRAASMQMPGQGLAQARLAQSQNATIQVAQLGAGSGSDLLAATAAADRMRVNGELQLGVQQERYNGQAQAGLQQQLGLQAQQRAKDLATYNNTKAALTQGAIQNAAGAIDGGAAYAAYGLNRGNATTTPAAAESPGIRGLNAPGYLPGLGGGRYRTSAQRLGLSF